MMDLEAQIVSQVLEKTQSEIILFVVIVLIAMILVFLPFYVMASKNRKVNQEQENIRQDRYIQREAQIIEVIKENSAVISKLKSTLDSNGVAMTEKQRRIEERLTAMQTTLSRIHERIDKSAASIEQLNNKLERRK